MELEFDNEIDALLRKADDGRGVLVGDTGKLHLHLDADEIAAFVENSVPDATRQSYMAHFADCEGCRKTLSSVILLNSEAGVETAPAVAAPEILANVVPWYRKLFLFPNLAYVLGSLVLLFSGFLAVSVLKNSGENAVSQVSQIDSGEPAVSGPNLGYEGEETSNTNSAAASPVYSSNTSSNAMASSANSAANSANTRNPVFAAEPSSADSDSKSRTSGETLDRVVRDIQQPAAAPQPPPLTKDQPFTMSGRTALPKVEEKRSVPAQEADKPKELNAMRENSPVAGGPSKAPKGPSRNERNDSRMRDDALAAKKIAKPDSALAPVGRRQVGGKNFEFKQGVWYDSNYRGQRTMNIRRADKEYKKLDGALRGVADNLPGTVVVLWRDKAYRIQ